MGPPGPVRFSLHRLWPGNYTGSDLGSHGAPPIYLLPSGIIVLLLLRDLLSMPETVSYVSPGFKF